MKKLVFFTLLFLTSFTSGVEAQKVKAKIKNMVTDSVYVKVLDVNGRTRRAFFAVPCKRGSFEFDVNTKEPVYVTFIPKNGRIDTKLVRGIVDRRLMQMFLYAQPGENYSVNGALKDGAITYNISGSELNEVLSAMRTKYIDMYRYFDMESEYFRDEKTKEQRDSVYQYGKDIEKKMLAEQLQYVEANPTKQLSGLFLSNVDYIPFDKNYVLISEEVRDGIFKELIKTKKYRSDLAQKNLDIRVGVEAPDFTAAGLDGKQITLSDHRGKYVFLYFWGSWCRWCVQGVDELNAMKRKYGDKMEFIGIACNDNEKDLRACIAEKKIEWESYFETDSKTGKRIPFTYGVTGYPKKVLVGPDGKILFIYSGAHPEFFKKITQYIK